MRIHLALLLSLALCACDSDAGNGSDPGGEAVAGADAGADEVGGQGQEGGAAVGGQEGQEGGEANEGEGEGNAGGEGGREGNERVCDPGQTQQCACPGSMGAQVCREDLQGWSPCECLGEDPRSLTCLPGESQDCTCVNGRHGAQPCLADGSDWGGCICADGPACEDSCDRGSIECIEESGGYRFCRDNNDDGCVEWTPELPCPEGLACFQGDCTAAADVCEDDCEADDLQCSGNGVQRCEDIDDDNCLDWTEPTPCADTQRCEAGVCEDREAGDECANDGQCGAELGLCDFGTCIEAYGRFWEVIVATGHIAEPFGDLFDDPDPMVIITVNDDEFRTSVKQNERNPAWFESFQIFIRRGDPFRWRLSDSDLIVEDRVGAWEFGDGVPISTLRTGSVLSFADDETSFVSLFFFPSDPPEDD